MGELEPAKTRSTVLQGDRKKAYRPIGRGERRAAFEAGLAAYERDDWFLAHEILEPAWMGTADVPERDLYQGLIKLAAAHVHWIRGNPSGMAKNLAGARSRLSAALVGGADAGDVDLPALVALVDDRLARLEASGRGDLPSTDTVPLPRRA